MKTTGKIPRTGAEPTINISFQSSEEKLSMIIIPNMFLCGSIYPLQGYSEILRIISCHHLLSLKTMEYIKKINQ